MAGRGVARLSEPRGRLTESYRPLSPAQGPSDLERFAVDCVSGTGTHSSFIPVGDRNGRASESRARNATFAFLPFQGFRDLISVEQRGTQPNPSIDFNGRGDTDRATHQLIPALMFEHALINSGFEKG